MIGSIGKGTCQPGENAHPFRNAKDSLGNLQEGWGAMNMDLAEILVYARSLTTTEENMVGGYLKQKYGIAAATYPAVPLAVGVTNPPNTWVYPFGTSVTAIAQVIPGVGTGPYAVQFYLRTGSGSLVAQGGPVTGVGPAFTTPLGVLADNTYQVYATIADSTTATATSGVNTFTVVPPVPTATTLGSSANPSTYGQAVTFTATIAPTPPSGGTMQFYSDGNPLGSPVAVSGGTAQYSTSLLTVPTRSITAQYSGYQGHEASSTATPLTQTVNQAVLTVTADNKVRSPGTANPTFTYKITGYQNGENFTSAGVTGAPVLSTLADTGSPGGSYAITCTVGNLAASNYSFTAVNGTLAIQAGAPPYTGGMACWYDAGTVGNITYKILTSQDLLIWADVTADAVDAGGFLTYTLPTASPKLFVRLEVATP